MIEIRFHGRGGQGAVVASRLLAVAAAGEGKDVQSFPFFGVERRGAPVTAFTKIDSGRIYVKSMIYEPDYVVVMDPSLLTAVDVTSGLKEDGVLLVNSGRSPEEMKEEVGIDSHKKPSGQQGEPDSQHRHSGGTGQGIRRGVPGFSQEGHRRERSQEEGGEQEGCRGRLERGGLRLQGRRVTCAIRGKRSN